VRSWQSVSLDGVEGNNTRDALRLVDDYLRQVDWAFGRILKGQMPTSVGSISGGGTPLTPDPLPPVPGITVHGQLTGLDVDDHTQYALLAGRDGSQVWYGATAGAGVLKLSSTSSSTKGMIYFGDVSTPAARPTSFISNSSPAWTVTGSSTFFGALNETNPNNATYITSPSTAGELHLGFSQAPAGSGDLTLRVSIRKNNSNAGIQLAVRFCHPNGTTITTPSITPSEDLGWSIQTAKITGQAATDLRAEASPYINLWQSAGTLSAVDVSWIQLDGGALPNSGYDETHGWLGVGTSNPAAVLHISSTATAFKTTPMLQIDAGPAQTGNLTTWTRSPYTASVNYTGQFVGDGSQLTSLVLTVPRLLDPNAHQDAASVTVTRGAVIAGLGAGVNTRWNAVATAAAASGQVLMLGANEPAWAAIPTQTSALLASATHTDTLTGAVLRGSLIVGNATPKWAALASGASGQALMMNATDPGWYAIPNQTSALLSITHTDTTATAVTRGALIAGIGASPAWTSLAAGASGQLLQMGATEPGWYALPAHAHASADVTGLGFIATQATPLNEAYGGTGADGVANARIPQVKVEWNHAYCTASVTGVLYTSAPSGYYRASLYALVASAGAVGDIATFRLYWKHSGSRNTFFYSGRSVNDCLGEGISPTFYSFDLSNTMLIYSTMPIYHDTTGDNITYSVQIVKDGLGSPVLVPKIRLEYLGA